MSRPTFSENGNEEKASLFLERNVTPIDTTDKSTYVTYDLPTKAGPITAGILKFKKNVRTFEGGTPQEFVDVIQAIREIWKRSSLGGAEDRLNIITTLILGEDFDTVSVALETDLAEEQEDNAEAELSVAHIETALKQLAVRVFPFRALENQKRYMTHGMKLPKSMTIRATASALQKINMALPVFPDATDEDRFSDNEILNILEFMVPAAWRTAFDKKGHIPATCDRKRFIEECEILEREDSRRD